MKRSAAGDVVKAHRIDQPSVVARVTHRVVSGHGVVMSQHDSLSDAQSKRDVLVQRMPLVRHPVRVEERTADGWRVVFELTAGTP